MPSGLEAPIGLESLSGLALANLASPGAVVSAELAAFELPIAFMSSAEFPLLILTL